MSGYYQDFVVPTTFAAPTDLANWTGQAAPANAVQLLRSATSLVLDASSGAYYTTDPLTGLPTDVAVLNTLRDATCIQAAAWAALGIDPLTGGIVTTNVKSQKAIGTARIGYADAAQAAQARADAVASLVPEAVRKLEQNNLLANSVWLYG